MACTDSTVPQSWHTGACTDAWRVGSALVSARCSAFFCVAVCGAWAVARAGAGLLCELAVTPLSGVDAAGNAPRVYTAGKGWLGHAGSSESILLETPKSTSKFAAVAGALAAEDIVVASVRFAGAALVVGCFFLGASYVYKLVFAVWLLPWLWRQGAAPAEERWRRLTLALLLAVLWFEGLMAIAEALRRRARKSRVCGEAWLAITSPNSGAGGTVKTAGSRTIRGRQ